MKRLAFRVYHWPLIAPTHRKGARSASLRSSGLEVSSGYVQISDPKVPEGQVLDKNFVCHYVQPYTL